MNEASERTAMPQAARLREARVINRAKQTANSQVRYGTDAEEVLKSAAPVFPLEVFPEALQVMTREADERLNYGIALRVVRCCSLLRRPSGIRVWWR